MTLFDCSGSRSQRVAESETFTVVAVQSTPVFHDRAATLELVAADVIRAGAQEADLVAFPESFVPGYPDWVGEPIGDTGHLGAVLQGALGPEIQCHSVTSQPPSTGSIV